MQVKLVNILTDVPILNYKMASISHNSNRHAVQYKRPVATWPPLEVVSLVYCLHCAKSIVAFLQESVSIDLHLQKHLLLHKIKIILPCSSLTSNWWQLYQDCSKPQLRYIPNPQRRWHVVYSTVWNKEHCLILTVKAYILVYQCKTMQKINKKCGCQVRPTRYTSTGR